MRKRKQPEAPPPKVEVQKQEGIITQEREYKLITPLFGGGAVTGAPDEVTVIRGTEIRGHLRFWWRACYGGRYATVKEMKEDEDRIWGAAAKKDEKLKGKIEDEETSTTVQIIVKPLNEEQAVEPFEIKPTDSKGTGDRWTDEYNPALKIPAYAAFPLQLTSAERKQEERPKSRFVYEDIEFCLTISFPQGAKKDIEGTLWAWETFGGIGARTRRGFGAIKLQAVALIEYKSEGKARQHVPLEMLPVATNNGVKEWITKKFAYFGIEKKAPAGVPSLSMNMLEAQLYIMPSSSNAKDAWKGLIEKLRTFRQPPKGNNSDWPDTRAIKRLRNTINPSAQQRYAFPKAVLGLPIVFHFPDKGKDNDLTLQGAQKGHDRLASSLILRPLLCRNQEAVGLAILLENHVENHTLPQDALQVVGKNKQEFPGIFEAWLNPSQTKDTALRGETDVWKAFMLHMKRNNNRERNNR